MEDMIKETLAKGVERHLAGELDLACQLYDAAIKLQPNHADANHNMGLLKLDKGNDLDALLYLQTALQADTSIAQFWLSYINALVKLERRDEAARIISLAKENGMEGEEFQELTRQLDLSLKKIKNTNNEINLTYSNSSKSNGTLEFQELDAAHNLNLSTKGLELIKLYENMVINGYNKVDGSKVTNTYNDFELRKFRNICKHHLQKPYIQTVLDYGGGGSDWDAPDFEPTSHESAKQFFQLKDVHTFEPARNLLEKKKSDCVMCMDVLEHIYISDVPTIVNELFFLAKQLLIINVACYKAAALLPNGENAHITVRNPDWWKGLVDAISINYKEVQVVLICSQTFSSGVVFETFKSKDWDEQRGYNAPYNYQTFGQS